MAEVVLFHHVMGLTDGVAAMAADLTSHGHTVHTPDLFDGQQFDSIEDGAGFVDELGFMTIVDRGVAAVEGLGPALVYAGISLGALPAQRLAQTRPGARGAVLMEACAPADTFADVWPAGVDVQVHGMEADPFFSGEGDIDAARELVASVDETTHAELCTYPGDQHLFVDRSLRSYVPDAASTAMGRFLELLERVDAGHT